MTIICFCIIFFMGFFGNSMVAYGLIPAKAILVTEISIYLLFLYAIINSAKRKSTFKLDLIWVWILFLLVTASSIVVNNSYNLKPIFSFRLIIRFYILYLALINLDLKNSDIFKLNKILFILFLIQLPAVAYKFSIYGVSERTIGTYAERGGGLTTMFPIVVISYCISWYVLYKKSLWYLIISGGFILWGIIGAKAALLFLYPITFFGLYYVLIIKRTGFKFFENVKSISFLTIISVIIIFILISLQPRLNKQREVGGRVDLSYALEFSKDYSTGNKFGSEKYVTGRIATTKLAFNQFIDDGFTNFVFGYGPGALTPSILSGGKSYDFRLDRIVNSYGMTGLVRIWAEYGFFGVILFCVLFAIFCWRSWRWYLLETSMYWKGFAAGSFFFSTLILFIFLTYNKVPVEGETLLPVFYYAMAVVYRNHLTEKTFKKGIQKDRLNIVIK
jgi:hypothetical protein